MQCVQRVVADSCMCSASCSKGMFYTRSMFLEIYFSVVLLKELDRRYAPGY